MLFKINAILFYLFCLMQTPKFNVEQEATIIIPTKLCSPCFYKISNKINEENVKAIKLIFLYENKAELDNIISVTKQHFDLYDKSSVKQIKKEYNYRKSKFQSGDHGPILILSNKNDFKTIRPDSL